MDQIVLGIFCVIGFVTFMLVLAGCKPRTREHRVVREGNVSLDKECPHDPAYWRGRGERCHLCGWGLMKIPDCDHDWEYIGGDKRSAGGMGQKCRTCGCTSITFALGDLHPGESKSIGIGVRFKNA